RTHQTTVAVHGVPSCNLPISVRLFLSSTRLQPPSTLFPYTTLFRSAHQRLFHEIDVPQEAGKKRPEGEEHGYAIRPECVALGHGDRKSTRLNSSHVATSYAVFCLKKKRTSISTS